MFGLTPEELRVRMQRDAINFSRLKYIEEADGGSPLAVVNATLNPMADSAPLRWGRCLHVALLEWELFDERIVVYPGKARSGNSWKQFKADHADDEILLPQERESILLARNMVLRNDAAVGALALDDRPATKEVRIYDNIAGVACAGTPDVFTIDDGILTDLKTTGALLTMSSIERLVFSRHTHVQLAMYSELLTQTGVDVRGYRIVYVQSHKPFDSRVIEVPVEVVRMGARVLQGWLDQYAYCLEQNQWPGLSTTIDELTIPSWYEEPAFA